MPGVLMHCLEECRCCWTGRGGVYPTRVVDESKEAKHVILVDYWHRNGVRKWARIQNLSSMIINHQLCVVTKDTLVIQ